MVRIRKRPGLFWRVLLAFLIIVMLIQLISSYVDLNRKKLELQALKDALNEQNMANQELQSLLDMQFDSEYIERIARDRLDYAYPDERIFYDTSGN